MPRCPVCGSTRIVIVVAQDQRESSCASCGSRWIQDGARQRAIRTVRSTLEPSPRIRIA